MSEQATQNTDKEIWRGKSRAEFGDPDRFYADSLFVPAGEVEALGINCGGYVIVKPIREWHKLEAERTRLMETMERLVEKWRNEALGQEVEFSIIKDKMARGETITISTVSTVTESGFVGPSRKFATELEAAIREAKEKANG